ncbi:hypothetical protein ABA31_14870 [Agrococcus baldri]|uniref:Uncharacterized protein n=2 Tax=Agrococcus baldri TaxID=153730 RepID=A0AA87RC68_9MICO|nr:hypothetical protein ABA31_14870 [Agrococcus baldri]
MRQFGHMHLPPGSTLFVAIALTIFLYFGAIFLFMSLHLAREYLKHKLESPATAQAKQRVLSRFSWANILIAPASSILILFTARDFNAAMLCVVSIAFISVGLMELIGQESKRIRDLDKSDAGE